MTVDPSVLASALTASTATLRNYVAIAGVFPKVFLFEGWESIRIQNAIDQMSGTFSISFVDSWRPSLVPPNFPRNFDMVPGQQIVIVIGGDVVIQGFIDKLDISVQNDDRTMEITGRDRTGDLVDSSCPTIPSEFRLMTILQLAQLFAAPFLIPVTIDVPPGEPFEKVTVKQGESIFDFLKRLAELRGLILQSSAIGGLHITDRSIPEIQGPIALLQGVNVIEASASYNDSERFQTYNIKGQTGGNELINRKLATQILGIATDPKILRPRTKTVIADGSVTLASAQRKANFEATSRAAAAIDVTVKVQGWRQDVFQVGLLWKPNLLVYVNIPFIGIQNAQMLIRSVQFNKSISEGTTTTLGLTRVDAYVPNLPVVSPTFDPGVNLGWLFSALTEVF